MEGYEEIEISKGFIIKSCDNCTHLKYTMIRSGFNPVYVYHCNMLRDKTYQHISPSLAVPLSILTKNNLGHIEPPGEDGDKCPFHKQIIREKNLDNLLNH